MRPAFLALTIALTVSLFGSPVAASDVPSCTFGDEVVDFDQANEWAEVVVDTRLSLSRSYSPADLVPVGRARISGAGRVRALVVEDLTALVAEARFSGVRLAVQSAYRSFAGQASTFREWVGKIGLARALRTSARAGHSEHQLGTAIDFKSSGEILPWKNISRWERSPAGRWLKANAWRFGFVMSYPKDLYQTVCYDYEPWHYRYVGREIALSIHQSGTPPRIWLMTHPAPTPTPTPTPSPSPSSSPIPTETASPTAEPTVTPEPSATAAPTPTVEPTPTGEPTAGPIAEPEGYLLVPESRG